MVVSSCADAGTEARVTATRCLCPSKTLRKAPASPPDRALISMPGMVVYQRTNSRMYVKYNFLKDCFKIDCAGQF